MPDKITEDMLNSVEKVAEEPVDMKSLGMRGVKFESLLVLIRDYYMLW